MAEFDGQSQSKFDEHAAHEQGFAAHFDQCIRLRIVEIESAQRTTRRHQLLLFLLVSACLFGMLAGAIVLVSSDLISIEVAIGGMIAICVPALSGVVALERRVPKLLKKTILPDVAAFFDGVSFQPAGTTPSIDTGRFRVLPSSNIRTTGDHFSVSRENQKFWVSEIEFIEGESSESDPIGSLVAPPLTSYGLAIWAEWDDPNAFDRTAVIPVEVLRKGRHDEPDQLNAKFRLGAKKVLVEDAAFSERFEVQSTNETAALRLLNKDLRDRLCRLFDIFAAVEDPDATGLQIGPRFAFYNHQFLAILPVEKDLFEPEIGISTQALMDDLRRLLKDINLMAQIIDQIVHGHADFSSLNVDWQRRAELATRYRAWDSGEVIENPDGTFDAYGAAFSTKEDAAAYIRSVDADSSWRNT